jgi:hypothetical protein
MPRLKGTHLSVRMALNDFTTCGRQAPTLGRFEYWLTLKLALSINSALVIKLSRSPPLKNDPDRSYQRGVLRICPSEPKTP